jgi:hypothetical protein
MSIAVPRYEVVQNAYVVDDIDKAVADFALAGIGPWLLLRDIQVPRVTYRGAEASVAMSAALSMAGGIQIELIAPHDDRPSCFRDLFAPGEFGLHHTAMFPPDWDEAVRAYQEAGFPCANMLYLPDGGVAAIMDTSAVLGHMVELYRDSEGLRQLYQSVKELCDNNGVDVVVDAGTVAEAME